MAAAPSVELDVIFVGEVPMPEAYVRRPDTGRLGRIAAVLRSTGEPLRAPLLAYVARHPTAGTIVIDTGLHPDALSDLRGDYGGAMYLLFRKLRPAGGSFDEQLRELGVEPEEVELAVMTHLHVDHTSGMRLLPNARFAISRREWKAAHGRAFARQGYVGAHLPPEHRVRLVDLEREGEPHGPFSETVDLLGDGSMRLVSTPGHTAGHMSVLVRLEGGREALVVGDAVYTLDSLREESFPLLTVSDELYMRSLRELKAYAEAEPDAILVPTHDERAWRSLRDASPRYAASR